MKNFRFNVAIVFLLFIYFNSFPQEKEKSKKLGLFDTGEILNLELKYSQKDLKKSSEEDLYRKTNLTYLNADGSSNDLNIEIKARGNYRLKNCYYAPIKVKINLLESKGTLFEGHKKFKIVLPCLKQKSANDYVVKEYLAYKIYENTSPYHFKTRLLNIKLIEERGNKIIEHKLKGILIEDDAKFAERHQSRVVKRPIHPLQQDDLCSVKNAFFQYMIANTDYSMAYRHNEKLFYIDKKIICTPYDFDMSGLVNASYAVVSQIQNQQLPINKVTQRMYRGFNRDRKYFEQARRDYLENKETIINVIDGVRPYFNNEDKFKEAKTFISGFYQTLHDTKKFNNRIVNMARKE